MFGLSYSLLDVQSPTCCTGQNCSALIGSGRHLRGRRRFLRPHVPLIDAEYDRLGDSLGWLRT